MIKMVNINFKMKIFVLKSYNIKFEVFVLLRNIFRIVTLQSDVKRVIIHEDVEKNIKRDQFHI